MSALPPKADIGTQSLNVCFCANSGLMRCSKICRYSTTSSVRASNELGGSRPSALAVLRLIDEIEFRGPQNKKISRFLASARWH